MSVEVLPAGYHQYPDQPRSDVAYFETKSFDSGDQLRLTQAGDLGVVYGVLRGLESCEGRWSVQIQTSIAASQFVWLDEVVKIEVGE